MAQESKRKQPERQIGNLELNKETLAELTVEQSEQAQGGLVANCSGKATSCGGTFQNCCPINFG
jgi:hypothetical protein